MKNIFFIIFTVLLISCGQLKAQFEGKQFVSGSAGLNFGNTNPSTAKATNGYGYNFNVDIGKFKTNTKAVGWRISSSLGGGKSIYNLYNNGSLTEYEKDGIKSFSAGVGRFWQFYKQFNDKIGIFGGPNVDLSFSNSRQYETSSDANFLFENKANTISISAGLSAGLYYRFSEKWWVNASLAFASPFSVGYSFLHSNVESQNEGNLPNDSGQLNYSFSPTLTFPSVGFGLRYFYNR